MHWLLLSLTNKYSSVCVLEKVLFVSNRKRRFCKLNSNPFKRRRWVKNVEIIGLANLRVHSSLISYKNVSFCIFLKTVFVSSFMIFVSHSSHSTNNIIMSFHIHVMWNNNETKHCIILLLFGFELCYTK